ncbi:MAG: 2-isopropylmalate synthase, partial [Paracoccaceae bacterium]|nr:2-isopropylmalate synthase [Paracoccaceae bacterium]
MRMAGMLIAVATAVAAQGSGDVITKQYDNGGVYKGTFKDGKQDGTGTYTMPNGYTYTGDWVMGQMT